MAAVRSKLKQFPEIVKADIDRPRQRITMLAKPSFDQYVALEHSMEDAGGAIHMFHAVFQVPQAHFAALGVRDHTADKLLNLEDRLRAVQGVRSVIIDQDRWFTDENGLDVGGAVVFADRSPRLEFDLAQTAKQAGFIFEMKDHDHEGDHDKWSEMNHAFAGLCLILLAILGMLQIGLSRPPTFVRYGSVFVWLALFVFLFIRADRNAWPLGSISWWDSFREWDTAQHRAGTGMLLIFAAGDYLRLKNGWSVDPKYGRWGLLAVGLAGSIMLFMHLHRTIDPAHYAQAARMNAQHIAMATCALGFTISKFAWDTRQAPKKAGRYLWLVFLLALGVVLNLYVE